MVDSKEKMKKKIEEIYMDTLKLTDDEWVAKYGEGNGYHEAFETLIQEERKEAVEGFVDNIGWKKPSEVIDLADDVIDGRSLVKQMETYLQSLDKGDTDENR
jgi:hypothetical protein